jgi:hypothetical protein
VVSPFSCGEPSFERRGVDDELSMLMFGSSSSGSPSNVCNLSKIRTTSGESWAKDGIYAFIATTDAPNPTFANMASRAERYQTGEEDDKKRKMIAAIEPRAAKQRSNRLRWGAVVHFSSVSKLAMNELTMVSNPSHGYHSDSLEGHGYRIDV